MRALITGITGFAGSHLAEFLLGKKGLEVVGVGRMPRDRAAQGRLRPFFGKIAYVEADIADFSGMRRVLKKFRPERIFHLAGVSSVRESWKDPARTLHVNVQSQLGIFEAVRGLGLRSRIHVAGSSEVYGDVPDGRRSIGEGAPFRPFTPYGVSKAAQDLLVYQYFRSFRLPAVATRAFPHAGPGQDEGFVASNFARQIALIEAGKQEPVLRVGNLRLVRDFTDVRDTVRAYWMALEKGDPGQSYNVCRGEGIPLRRIVEVYLKASFVKVKVVVDRQRLRTNEPPRLVGDSSKLRERTGWRPLIGTRTTLVDLLNYWRGEIGR
ncbi:MAG: GDP-mannose 4,6-dehydratase [Candidatus Omnitrophica bacterium]|nr:GDP-mannose 4,6-dehydratase [Candidatus Omnitrophota bacterium]